MANKPEILNEKENIEGTEFNFKEEFGIVKNNFNKDNKTQESVSTVPTYTPKSFLEQFKIYDDGTNQRLYVYLDGTWKYVNLL